MIYCPLFVFDLDGTIANLDHRLHFIKQKKPDYERFLKEAVYDTPIEWIISLMKRITDSQRTGKILILSGRMETVRDETALWLEKYSIPFDFLVMRPAKNHEPDEVLKIKMLREFLEGWKKEYFEFIVEFIVDDRQKVVDMWRREGFNCLQCNAWKEWK